MKELTIEQKARAYDEALEKAKEFYILCKKCGAKDTIDFLEDSFPELTESEDERIRKCIGDVVREHDWSHIFGVTKDDCLAWLEKQGTSYTKRDVDDAYVEGMAFAKYELEKQSEQEPTDEEMKEALRTEYEKGRADAIAEMQKPWSEEDEEFLRRAINATKDVYPVTAKWLKSLKRRIGGV